MENNINFYQIACKHDDTNTCAHNFNKIKECIGCEYNDELMISRVYPISFNGENHVLNQCGNCINYGMESELHGICSATREIVCCDDVACEEFEEVAMYVIKPIENINNV